MQRTTDQRKKKQRMSSILSRHIFCSSLSRVSMSNQYTNMPCYTALQIIHLVNLAKYIQPLGTTDQTYDVCIGPLLNMCAATACSSTVKVFQLQAKIFDIFRINVYLIIRCVLLKECSYHTFQQWHVIHIFRTGKKQISSDVSVSILHCIQLTMHVCDCQNDSIHAHLSMCPKRVCCYCFN